MENVDGQCPAAMEKVISVGDGQAQHTEFFFIAYQFRYDYDDMNLCWGHWPMLPFFQVVAWSEALFSPHTNCVSGYKTRPS